MPSERTIPVVNSSRVPQSFLTQQISRPQPINKPEMISRPPSTFIRPIQTNNKPQPIVFRPTQRLIINKPIRHINKPKSANKSIMQVKKPKPAKKPRSVSKSKPVKVNKLKSVKKSPAK